MSTAPTHQPAAPSMVRQPTVLRLLAWGGLLGPVLFTVVVLAQQMARRDSYNATTQLVSDLTAGPYGWIQQANFILFGVLLITFAAGLHADVCLDRPSRTRFAPALPAVNGVGLIVAGTFPLRTDSAGHVHDPIGVHTANGVIFFLSIGIVLCTMSAALRADPRWCRLAPYTLVTGLALLLLFAVVVTLVRPPDAPLHHWLGAVQRLILTTWLTTIATLALRLRHLARHRPDPSKRHR